MSLLDRFRARTSVTVLPPGHGLPNPPDLERSISAKAVYGGSILGAYQNDIPLYGQDPQARMAAYLRAYKVGWFYKAGHKIAGDVSGLARTLSFEDTEGDNADEIREPSSIQTFDKLTDPLQQFLRLMERPNPYQTGRTLFTKTQIRLDFAGLAFWYLEGGETQLPTGLYGISPTRMTPSLNAAGQLLGWVMDKDDRGGGVPFTTDEILPFVVPGIEEDVWCGQGVVEAVYAHVPLSDLLARHTSNVLTLGGRLAGMMWPKERALDEAEFEDAKRAWRNVASDPDAGKRLLIFPEPMEYAQGAATPEEIGIPELSDLSRDSILTAFPISPYQLGVPMPGGLNSAETRKEDRHDYWEGTIHPRVELLEETIQFGLVSRYEAAVGRALDFDIEEPNLDDAPTLIEKVGALRGLWSTGFDPKEAVAAVGLDHIKWTKLPATLDPFAPPPPMPTPGTQPDPAAGMRVVARDPTTRDPAASQQTVVGKAVTRQETLGREFPGLQAALIAFLRDQRERLIAEIEATMPTSKAARAAMKADPPWWDGEREDRLLREALRTVYLSIGRDALQVAAENTDRIIGRKVVDKVLDQMLADSGVRITDINETTRQTIAETLQEGVRRGYSIAQLTRGVAEEGFGGVQGALMANGVNVWDDLRAETIARTETMNAYNTAALRGYGELNVRQVVAIDGDKDGECATRDGGTFTVDDALSISDHPNGTLDWAPLTN